MKIVWFWIVYVMIVGGFFVGVVIVVGMLGGLRFVIVIVKFDVNVGCFVGNIFVEEVIMFYNLNSLLINLV